MKQIDEYAAIIEASPDRAQIERCLEVAFGETDIRNIKSDNLLVFLERCLPRLRKHPEKSSNTY